MKNIAAQIQEEGEYIDYRQQKKILKRFVNNISEEVNSILILPPDYTRKHSGAGQLTAILYKLLKNKYRISIMPALGTHVPMIEDEITSMFGEEIPLDIFEDHDFINDTVEIGKVPAEFVNRVSEETVNQSIKVTVNKRLVNGKFDLIISIGQVIPHAVVGMANYNKNIFVGCGGSDIINTSHFVGAAYGMERLLGKDHSPVRKIFDYAQENLATDLQVEYMLTVNSTTVNSETGIANLLGLFIGKDRKVFEKAVKLSQKYNINYIEKPLDKVVVYMDEDEFKSTWLGCKAIYRTRLAIADGGELIVIAPGLKSFGEYEKVDKLIRKYGYAGRKKILQYVQENQDLKDNLAAAAHVIHGSTNGRFKVTFATDLLTKEELENVNFNHMSMEKALKKYPISELNNGYNQLAGGERVYYIDNPTTGLWSVVDR